MEAGANHGHKVGDVLIGIPFHICPTVALYERAYIVENGLVKTEWKTTARDRK
jgi:D-threonine aldolase